MNRTRIVDHRDLFDLCPDFRLQQLTLSHYVMYIQKAKRGRFKVREGSDPRNVGLKPHENRSAATSPQSVEVHSVILDLLLLLSKKGQIQQHMYICMIVE